ncbi:MAG TPA: NDP-sugar synthase, partial [Elusimicrobiota bacterium]|nr:NDP-sugar synthase [Elusimicrobiota bacterium]
QLDQVKKHGVREVVLALGYQASHFQRHLGDGRRWGMRFIYSLEKEPLGTGGAIRKALPFLKGTTFILNGDVLSDVDLTALLSFHRRNKADGTLALMAVKDPSSYGLIETEESGKIKKFVEKPSAEEMNVNTINAGFYVFEENVVRQIPANQPVSIERDVFPKLVKNGFSLYGFPHRGYWSDIGTLKSYWDTHMDLMQDFSGSPDKSIKKLQKGIWGGTKCRLDTPLKLEGTLLMGHRCRLGPNVTVRGCVSLGDGCTIAENVILTDCVVLEKTHVGVNATLENCIVGENCHIGSFCHVGPGTVLANRSTLEPYTKQISGLSREPHA